MRKWMACFLALCLLLAGCGADGGQSSAATGGDAADVDTVDVDAAAEADGFAALRAGVPYTGYRPRWGDADGPPYTFTDLDGTGRELEDFLYNLTVPEGNIQSAGDWDHSRVLWRTLLIAVQRTSVADYPELREIQDRVGDDVFLLKEHVEALIHELYGEDMAVVHRSEDGEWTWHGEEGVYTLTPAGGGNLPIPVVYGYEDAGDHYVVEAAYYRTMMDYWEESGDSYEEYLAVETRNARNAYPRYEITVRKNADGTLTFASCTVLAETAAEAFFAEHPDLLEVFVTQPWPTNNSRGAYEQKQEIVRRIGELGYVAHMTGWPTHNNEKALAFLDAVDAGTDAELVIVNVWDSRLSASGSYIYRLAMTDGVLHCGEYRLWLDQVDDVRQDGRGEAIVDNTVFHPFSVADLAVWDDGYLHIGCTYIYMSSDSTRIDNREFYIRAVPLPEQCVAAYQRYIAPIKNGWQWTNWRAETLTEFEFRGQVTVDTVRAGEFFDSLWQWENETGRSWSNRDDLPYPYPAEAVEDMFLRYFNFTRQETRERLFYDEQTGTYALEMSAGGRRPGTVEVWGVRDNADGSVTLDVACFYYGMISGSDAIVRCDLTVMHRADGSFYYIACEEVSPRNL